MTPFVQFQAIAAPLPIANVDTDKIIPARFLKTISREGLGRALFSTLRDDPDFILNRAPWNRAGILIAGENFGCGSSREHAPWALLDFGIRCVIAPSIADIFYNNCFKNGILPITLPAPEIAAIEVLVSIPATATIGIDLPAQTVTAANGRRFQFAIDGQRKQDLIDGADEIERSLGFSGDIDRFEQARVASQPWFPRVSQQGIGA